MKKYLTGSLAVVMALSAVALPKTYKAKDSFYWYKRTGLNTYVLDVHATDPSISCPEGNKICAKGFEESQDPSSITDVTVGDTPDRTKN